MTPYDVGHPGVREKSTRVLYPWITTSQKTGLPMMRHWARLHRRTAKIAKYGLDSAVLAGIPLWATARQQPRAATSSCSSINSQPLAGPFRTAWLPCFSRRPDLPCPQTPTAANSTTSYSAAPPDYDNVSDMLLLIRRKRWTTSGDFRFELFLDRPVVHDHSQSIRPKNRRALTESRHLVCLEGPLAGLGIYDITARLYCDPTIPTNTSAGIGAFTERIANRKLTDCHEKQLFTFVLPLVLAAGLAGCDNQDYIVAFRQLGLPRRRCRNRSRITVSFNRRYGTVRELSAVLAYLRTERNRRNALAVDASRKPPLTTPTTTDYAVLDKAYYSPTTRLAIPAGLTSSEVMRGLLGPRPARSLMRPTLLPPHDLGNVYRYHAGVRARFYYLTRRSSCIANRRQPGQNNYMSVPGFEHDPKAAYGSTT